MSIASERLMQYVIFDHPRDYPRHFVVRELHIGPGTVTPGEAALADSLENARKLVPPGLVRIPRSRTDDPTIVETWT